MKIDIQKMRYERRKRKITLEQLGEEIEISKANVCNWEKGRKSIPPHHHDKLIEILGPNIFVSDKQEEYPAYTQTGFEVIVKHNDNQVYTQRFDNIDLPKLINYLNNQP